MLSIQAGQRGVLVLCGGLGVGKTALLRYLHDDAAGCRVAPSAGAESETKLTYSGLNQLCGPLKQVVRLPDPLNGTPWRPFSRPAREGSRSVHDRASRLGPALRGGRQLSPRTVEWHLRKVFGKLGVKSRKELADPLGQALATRLGAESDPCHEAAAALHPGRHAPRGHRCRV
jgi:regulatory LuxR family protein